jgi:hypothetical protein
MQCLTPRVLQTHTADSRVKVQGGGVDDHYTGG